MKITLYRRCSHKITFYRLFSPKHSPFIDYLGTTSTMFFLGVFPHSRFINGCPTKITIYQWGSQKNHDFEMIFPLKNPL